MRPGDHATGWLMSFLLHGSIALAALFFLQRIQLEPDLPPFTWNVAMVAEPPGLSPVSRPSLVRPASSIESSPAAVGSDTTGAPKPMLSAPIVPPAPAPSAPTSSAPAPQPSAPPKEATRTALTEPTALSPPLPMSNEMLTEKQHSAAPPPSARRLSVGERHTAVPSPQAESQRTMPPMSPSQEEPSAWTPELAADLPEPSSTQPSAEKAPQVAAVPPAAQPKAMKPDYGWLAELMARWIQDLDKRYPAILRTEGVQGKVTLTAVLHQDGMLSDVRIAKSSGNLMLDQIAVEDVRKGPPVRLSHALDKPQMPVKFSLIYDLTRTQ